ncbi:hypothetical protein T12_16508 [Trichinella patagoniensis]|uniref:Uncharacterized protein n=1 Tax=Trichinella patagoniensis TaxID=990121 RepID=A0A0V0YQQ5_9BILA|nr:hypothetical protein T12_16508 [Trichinella patagoniensis]
MLRKAANEIPVHFTLFCSNSFISCCCDEFYSLSQT